MSLRGKSLKVLFVTEDERVVDEVVQRHVARGEEKSFEISTAKTNKEVWFWACRNLDFASIFFVPPAFPSKELLQALEKRIHQIKLVDPGEGHVHVNSIQ